MLSIRNLKRLGPNMLIGTHSGSFHADESLACFILQKTAQFANADIVRTRDPVKLAECDVVVDVGGVYDPSTHRYDHHQREFQETMTIADKVYETRLSSAGLVYRHFGREVVATVCGYSEADNKNEIDALYKKVYEEIIEAYDGVDNGVDRYPSDIKPKYKDSSSIAARVSRLNPWWNEEGIDIDERFKKAVAMTGEELTDRLKFYAFAWIPARKIVEDALSSRKSLHPSGRVMQLPRSLPWKEHLFDIEKSLELGDEEKILYVLYPEDYKNNETRWRVQCVPEKSESFANRKSLPKEWHGMRDEELSKISGIEGCIFVHASGFIGGNKTEGGIQAMALRALAS